MSLEVKTHGFIQNEKEKLAAFEREDVMRKQRDEAVCLLRDVIELVELLANKRKANQMRYVVTMNATARFISQFKFKNEDARKKT